MSQGTLIGLNESPILIPHEGTNANGRVVYIVKDESPTRIDVISDIMYYLGWAKHGTLEDEAKWKIKRIYQIGTVWYQEFADGNEFYDNVWDDRSVLTYF